MLRIKDDLKYCNSYYSRIKNVKSISFHLDHRIIADFSQETVIQYRGISIYYYLSICS